MPDKYGNYSLEEMRTIVEGGGTVLLGRKAIRKIEDLPNAAQQVKAGMIQPEEGVQSLDAEIERLQQLRASLTAGSTPAPAGTGGEGGQPGAAGEGQGAGAAGEGQGAGAVVGKKTVATIGSGADERPLIGGKANEPKPDKGK